MVHSNDSSFTCCQGDISGLILRTMPHPRAEAHSGFSQASKIDSFAGILKVFKRQSHKMIKHTQTIRREIADEVFECV